MNAPSLSVQASGQSLYKAAWVDSDGMAWTEPGYSRSRVNGAGATYIDPQASAEDRELALVVINNWRSSHSFPLNTLQMGLRRVAADRDPDPTVAQRIKRLPSIRHKLERIQGMDLARMQDIGGCRAVVSSVAAVDEVVRYYKETSQIKHRLVREDPYITNPPPSGYRGTHLIYAYNSDKKPTYNGLRIELQIRSRLQHAWATAVETVGTFTQQALKASQGREDWLRFFALMSSALALREGTLPVPGTPTDADELREELRKQAKRLRVVERLRAYGETLKIAEKEMQRRKGGTFLLELDTVAQALSVWSYDSTAAAAEDYSALERATENAPERDVVLVSVESLDKLRRAYPNYFLDATVFVDSVEEAIA